MAHAAITAHELGKKYRIAADRAQYGTLRDALVNATKRPFTDRSRARDHWALRDVSFDLATGDRLGLIGKNGAGKTTLLKILARITHPTEGWAEIRGRVGALLEVGSGFNPELTGRENVYVNGAILGMSRREMVRKFDDIVTFSGVEKFIDTPVKRYSTGMHMRLAFAVAAHLQPEILLVDEVLAVGDAEFQKRCLGKMDEIARSGRTIVFVSHQLPAIKSLCNRCFLLEHGKVVFDGAPVEAVEQYLTRGAEAYATGEIPHDWPRAVNTGEAFFRHARILDDEAREVRELYYRSPFVVRVGLEVLQPIPDAIIHVYIGTPDGEIVISTQSSDAVGLLALDPGMWEIDVDVPLELLPRQYTLFLSLSHSDGRDIELVERVHDFTVLRTSRAADLDYSWDESWGYVSVRAPWSVRPGATRSPSLSAKF